MKRLWMLLTIPVLLLSACDQRYSLKTAAINHDVIGTIRIPQEWEIVLTYGWNYMMDGDEVIAAERYFGQSYDYGSTHVDRIVYNPYFEDYTQAEIGTGRVYSNSADYFQISFEHVGETVTYQAVSFIGVDYFSTEFVFIDSSIEEKLIKGIAKSYDQTGAAAYEATPLQYDDLFFLGLTFLIIASILFAVLYGILKRKQFEKLYRRHQFADAILAAKTLKERWGGILGSSLKRFCDCEIGMNYIVLGMPEKAKESLESDLKFRPNRIQNYLLAALYILQKEPQKANAYLIAYSQRKNSVIRGKSSRYEPLISSLASGNALPSTPRDIDDPLLLTLYGVKVEDKSRLPSPERVPENNKARLSPRVIRQISIWLLALSLISVLGAFLLIAAVGPNGDLLTPIETMFLTDRESWKFALLLPVPAVAIFFGIRYLNKNGGKAFVGGIISLIFIFGMSLSPLIELSKFSESQSLFSLVNDTVGYSLPEPLSLLTKTFDDADNFPSSETEFQNMTVSVARFNETTFAELEISASNSSYWTSSLSETTETTIPSSIVFYLLNADHYLLYSVTNGTYNEVTDSHNEGFILLEINIEYQALFIGIYDGK